MDTIFLLYAKQKLMKLFFPLSCCSLVLLMSGAGIGRLLKMVRVILRAADVR